MAPRVLPGSTSTSAPRVDADAATGSSSAAAYLSRISLLMEEEELDELAVATDHAALLHAQQPFAQILSGAPLLPDQQGPAAGSHGTDMFADAFFKGVEEATKFLPAAYTAATLVSKDKDRHDVEPPVADAGRTSEMFGEMTHRGSDACSNSNSKELDGLNISVENVPSTKDKDGDGKKKARKRSRAQGKRQPAAMVVDLHTLLIHCAKAVMDNRQSANKMLSQIKEHASPTGDGMQRLAYCFAQGLEARLAGTGSHLYRSLTANRISVLECLKAHQLFMTTCCFRKVAIMFANKTIFDIAAGRSKLHIVDYGLQCGLQWLELLRLLVTRDGGPPMVRITIIDDLPRPGFLQANHMAELGHRLTICARDLRVPLSFRFVVAPWQTIHIDDLNVEPDEVLVVNDLFSFRTLMDENVVSADSPSPRNDVLYNIRGMKSDVFIQAVANGSYGTTFLSRFREALFYHSAMFDMLDVTMPRESQLRLVLERDIFGWVGLNAIACEGEDRVERCETYKQWQVRNQRAGLRQLPLNGETVKMVKDMVKNQYHKNFDIEEGQRWLLQGWKGRILLAHSMWVAADGAIFD